MTKDRLGELKQKSDIVIDVEKTAVTDSARGEVNQQLRKTFEKSESIATLLDKIEENLDTIKFYIKKTDDLGVNQKVNNTKLEDLFQNNKTLCLTISQRLKEFEKEVLTSDKQSAEGRIREIQYNNLRSRYSSAFKKHCSELERYKNIQKDVIQAQLKAKGVTVTNEELSSLLEDGKDIQLFTENILAETLEAKRILADVEERHQQIIKIEQMLTDVRDLFVQMAIIVDNQQDLIDRVEFQAQKATEYIKGIDLGKVRRQQTKRRKIKLYFWVGIIIFLILVILIIFKT